MNRMEVAVHIVSESESQVTPQMRDDDSGIIMDKQMHGKPNVGQDDDVERDE